MVSQDLSLPSSPVKPLASNLPISLFTAANSTVALRRELREKNIHLTVIKNSLARRAAEGTPLAVAFESCEGTLAMVILTFDCIVEARADVDADRFTWEIGAARTRLMAATAKARERFLDNESRRAERARERKAQAQEKASQGGR